MSNIIPTVGRMVYFNELAKPLVEGQDGLIIQRAAVVTQVHSDDCVDLTVFRPGDTTIITSVMQGGADRTWDWMPGQAKN